MEAGKEGRTNEEKLEPFDMTQTKMAHRETVRGKNLIQRRNNRRILSEREGLVASHAPEHNRTSNAMSM